jgi:RimJ/RimL family protein N-acetyltransferase
MLITRRTKLIEAAPEVVRALVRMDRAAAGSIAGAVFPDDWPGNADASAGLALHLAELDRDARQVPWRIRLIVVDDTVIGSINLKGPPSDRGDVEIGWGLIVEARGRGLATEAARAVIEWAFESPEVRRVIATIPSDNERSQKVARRLGMQPTLERRRDLPVWATDRDRARPPGGEAP